MRSVNLAAKFRQFDDHWSPKIVGELNDSYVKLVKVQGEFCGITMTWRTSCSSSCRAAC